MVSVIRSLIVLLMLFPAKWVETLLFLLCKVASRIPNKEAAKIYTNLEHIKGLSGGTFPARFVTQVFFFQLQCTLDSLFESVRPGTCKIVNMDQYIEFLQNMHSKFPGKGLIVISAHIGSWELIPKLTVQANDRPFYGVAKRSKSNLVTDLMLSFRENPYIKVFWNDSKNLLREMIGATGKESVLGLVMDQKPGSRKGIELDFLGHPAEFVGGPASIAQKTGSPVFAAYCVRIGTRKFKLVFEEIYDGDPASLDTDEKPILALTRTMVQSIESIVEQYPEQWVWNYKRWKFQ